MAPHMVLLVAIPSAASGVRRVRISVADRWRALFPARHLAATRRRGPETAAPAADRHDGAGRSEARAANELDKRHRALARLLQGDRPIG